MSTTNTAQAGYDARDRNHDGRVSTTEKVFDKGAYVDRDMNGIDDRDRNRDGRVSLKEKIFDKHASNEFTDRDRNMDGFDDRDRNKDGKVSMTEKIKDKFSGHKTESEGAYGSAAAYSGTMAHDSRDLNRDGHVSMGEKAAAATGLGASEYCTDLRCHGYSPCARHPQMAAHHHHGGGIRSGEQSEVRMTLAEEQLSVGKRQVAAGGLDIHKHVETHHVREEVPVRREEVIVERRPIIGATADRNVAIDNKDTHITVPLYREEVVAEKLVVPKEEVVVQKKAVFDTKVVEADLRSEFVEADRIAAGTQTGVASTGFASTGFATDKRDEPRRARDHWGEDQERLWGKPG
jgi:uncharacterized protein (TIGR02271 family)